MPTKEALQRSRMFRILGPAINRPYLWSWRRQYVANAAFWGMICAFTPWPMQMFQSAFFSVLLKCHMPTILMCVWISNPITIPALFYFAYWVGTLVLGIDPQVADLFSDWQGIQALFGEIWQPLLLGCVICGFSSAIIMRFAVSSIWIYLTRAKRQQRTNSAT